MINGTNGSKGSKGTKEGKGYHKLLVWQRAKELVVIVYRLTEGFPKSEEFGLKSQARRAAVSIIANIAEGYSRRTARERARFIEIATGSLFELESHFDISLELDFISKIEYEEFEKKRGEVGFLLSRYAGSF